MILNGGGHILWNLLRKGLECLCVEREPSWLLFFILELSSGLLILQHLGWTKNKTFGLQHSRSNSKMCYSLYFYFIYIYICSQFFLRVQILYLYYFENFLMGPCSTCGSSLMMNLIFFSHMMMSNIML